KQCAEDKIVYAGLCHRRHLGHQRRARAARHDERPHLAGLDTPDRGGDAGDQHLDLPRHDVGDAGAAALVRHMRHVELEAMCEQPSGCDRAATSAPSVPPPPGRFSTTTCCPRRSLMNTASTRPSASVVPPAAKGTIILMGLWG